MIVRSWGDDRFDNSSFDQVEMIAGIFSLTYALLDASKLRPWYAAYPRKPATKRTKTRNRPPIIERNLFNVCTSPIGRYRTGGFNQSSVPKPAAKTSDIAISSCSRHCA